MLPIAIFLNSVIWMCLQTEISCVNMHIRGAGGRGRRDMDYDHYNSILVGYYLVFVQFYNKRITYDFDY